MTKLLNFLSFSMLGFLAYACTVTPDSSVVWLASSSEAYNIARYALMAVLFVFLVTLPPRNTFFRVASGLFSIGLAAWSLHGLYVNSIQLLDGFAFLSAAISISIAVLEYFPERRISLVKYVRKFSLPTVTQSSPVLFKRFVNQ